MSNYRPHEFACVDWEISINALELGHAQVDYQLREREFDGLKSSKSLDYMNFSI